jgi:hypothetical protein
MTIILHCRHMSLETTLVCHKILWRKADEFPVLHMLSLPSSRTQIIVTEFGAEANSVKMDYMAICNPKAKQIVIASVEFP